MEATVISRLARSSTFLQPIRSSIRWSSLLSAYDRKVQTDGFLPDACQAECLKKLDVLHNALSESKGTKVNGLAPRGLYMYGGVGTGKTMMLDLFHQEITKAGISCQRQHFHEFLQAVHARLHKLRKKVGARRNLLGLAAEEYKAEFPVLAFDEAHVLNVGDALMLRTFFESYFAAGGVMVATSNVAPDDLYASGINREVFLPFLNALKERCDFYPMQGRHDYRSRAVESGRLRGAFLWRDEEIPSTFSSPDQFPVLYQELGLPSGALQGPPAATDIDVGFGRTLHCRHTWSSTPDSESTRRVVHFGFDDLCRTATGPSEWVGLAEFADAIIVTGLPHFPVHDEDVARRFITFVDIVYDKQRFLVVTADSSPENLFSELVNKYSDGAPISTSPKETTHEVPATEPERKMWMPAHGVASGRHGVVFKKPKQLQYGSSGAYTTLAADDLEESQVKHDAAMARTGGRAEYGVGSKERVMQGVVEEDTNWVEWSATGLKDASLFDLSPVENSTQLTDKLLPFQRCASRLYQMQLRN